MPHSSAQLKSLSIAQRRENRYESPPHDSRLSRLQFTPRNEGQWKQRAIPRTTGVQILYEYPYLCLEYCPSSVQIILVHFVAVLSSKVRPMGVMRVFKDSTHGKEALCFFLANRSGCIQCSFVISLGSAPCGSGMWKTRSWKVPGPPPRCSSLRGDTTNNSRQLRACQQEAPLRQHDFLRPGVPKSQPC